MALLLPALVFVFLKYAGSNQFDIPIYYEEGVLDVAPRCPKLAAGPYVLPDSVWKASGGQRKVANVVIFSGNEDLNEAVIAETVLAELGAEEVSFVPENSLNPDSLIRTRWRECAFMINSPWQTVLYDNMGRIRGYYNLQSRDELDRLRVELKILLKQY